MNKHRTLGAGGVALASLLGLVACGGSTSTAGGGPSGVPGAMGAAAQAGRPAIDPCSLISRADAESAMGEPATGAGKAQGSECKYTAQANDGSDMVSINVDKPEILKAVVTGNGVGGTATTEAVSGLGDEAIYEPGLQILFVRTGSQAFLVQLATAASLMKADHGASAKAIDVTLARAALGRLGGGPVAAAAASSSSSAATTSASTTSSIQTTTSAPASNQIAAIDACTLVTQDDASTALGVAAGPPDKALGCSYKGPADETVSVMAVNSTRAKQTYDSGRAHGQGNASFQDFPEVADGAFMSSGGGAGQFFCIKGTTIVSITLSMGHDAQVADALMTVGKTACGRL
jgi:hypothetical protein